MLCLVADGGMLRPCASSHKRHRLRRMLPSFVSLQLLTAPAGDRSIAPEPRARHAVDLWRDTLIVYGGEGDGGDGKTTLLGEVWALNLTSYYNSGGEVRMTFPCTYRCRSRARGECQAGRQPCVYRRR